MLKYREHDLHSSHAEETWEISDLDGSNRRCVTLAQFLAENRKRADEAKAIFAASIRSLRSQPSLRSGSASKAEG